jgi:dimethylhistidine N-methyltransferase
LRRPVALASFDDIAPDREAFRAEVLSGLSQAQKSLPSKFFYDERGSDLFYEICNTPEYYPTRVETALLRRIAPEAAALIGPNCCLIEYGAGSSEKMRIILDALEAPAAFVAVDISKEHLLQGTRALAADHPSLLVHGVCADYSRPFRLPIIEGRRVDRKVAFFPGSSLGNFDIDEARDFLAAAVQVVGSGGGMLIGIDMKKDEAILNAAYNDAAGVTAAFNLNMLRRINREAGANFDLQSFRHNAFFNAAQGRIEMHLVSAKDQKVEVAGRSFPFRAGETIHTENSYKYSIEEFQELARSACFVPVKAWTDPGGLFSVHYLEVQ